MDWLEDSISFLPNFLDDSYGVPEEIAQCDWWPQDQHQAHFPTHFSETIAAVAAVAAAPAATALDPLPGTPKSEFSKKRKLPANPSAGQRRRIASGSEGHGENAENRKSQLGGGKKGYGKGSGGNSGGSASKEARWAEQLLNPFAAAIDAANTSRVQHLLYVLQELASPTGDANHRLAFYGLQSLTRRLSSAGLGITAAAAATVATYATTEPRLFRSALIKFHEISPWFAFPNCLANSSILAAAASAGTDTSLRVIDAGVSHGVQWPTLLEALARRPGGTPKIVRLTVVKDEATAPFAAAPAGYDFAPHLLRYAKSIDLNFRVDQTEALPAAAAAKRTAREETVVICSQMWAGRVRTGFLRAMREMDPDLVVLSETGEGMIGSGEGDRVGLAGGFGRRAEVMWKFLESTSAAFKGRECEERRVMEGEAARILDEWDGEWAGKERWRERMEGEGFMEERIGEEAVEAGRALLRKYDGNWEMRAGGAAAGVGLWWKGQPVTFCSLWKPAKKASAAMPTAARQQKMKHSPLFLSPP
ncbi:Nodulation-signaling pathway 1 protein [Apostasia shenzhenica]|uniref:Nodulation-signaling pathway 1 protein n=1 Tax=Apostasia shenzhenica TaxID=1088818 RepID=A0A2I0ADF2_9ASPA|nr:Nodulation-signaling pathway 1 protein [Apostasia shenzhenica]